MKSETFTQLTLIISQIFLKKNRSIRCYETKFWPKSGIPRYVYRHTLKRTKKSRAIEIFVFLFQAIVNSSEITKFWESKKEETYRKTLDGHTRREKEYLSLFISHNYRMKIITRRRNMKPIKMRTIK